MTHEAESEEAELALAEERIASLEWGVADVTAGTHVIVPVLMTDKFAGKVRRHLPLNFDLTHAKVKIVYRAMLLAAKEG